jgi:hypothetical protein
MRQRLVLNAKINDKVSYTSRLEANFKNGDNTSETVQFNRNYFTIKDFLGLDNMLIGRQGAYFGKNMLVGKSSNNDGIVMSKKLGNVTLTGFMLEEDSKSMVTTAQPWHGDVSFNGIYAGMQLGKNADLEIGYTKADELDTSATASNPEAKSLDIGASVQFGKGFALVGEYVDTDNTDAPDGKAYAVQLTKGVKTTKIGATAAGMNIVDKTKAHTSGYLVGYRNIEANALAFGGKASIFSGSAPTYNSVVTGSSDGNDVKGMTYAYQNVLAKNTILSLEYQDLQKESTGVDLDKTFVGSIQFWF